MSIQELKSKIHNFVDNSSDEDKLNFVYKFMESEEQGDFWNNLSEEEKKEIEEGLEDIEKGNVVDHKTAMEQARKWL
jgi:predicted transcriptional regulator